MAKRERVHVVVDDTTIASGDVWAVIHPVWWTADIYNGPVAYELSFEKLSRSQRRVHAMLWYIQEVTNGGHRQFYGNSTGIVWKDAIEGWDAIGLPRFAQLVAASAERLGGSPSFDKDERNEQLVALRPDFEDLDKIFYELERKANPKEEMMKFVRSRPADFHFSGTIERVVLPWRAKS